MSFFKKLKDRLFKSSSKIDEGLEAIVQEAAEDVPINQGQEEVQVLKDVLRTKIETICIISNQKKLSMN